MRPKKSLWHVRLSKQLVKDVDHLSIELGVYRAEAIERLLREAILPHLEAQRGPNHARHIGRLGGEPGGSITDGGHAATSAGRQAP